MTIDQTEGAIHILHQVWRLGVLESFIKDDQTLKGREVYNVGQNSIKNGQTIQMSGQGKNAMGHQGFGTFFYTKIEEKT